MIRDPLDACSIAGVLVIGRLFLSHVTCGLGSPSTAQLRTARSPSVRVVSVGMRCILGGTARGSNTENGPSEILKLFALIVFFLLLPFSVLLTHRGKLFGTSVPTGTPQFRPFRNCVVQRPSSKAQNAAWLRKSCGKRSAKAPERQVQLQTLWWYPSSSQILH